MCEKLYTKDKLEIAVRESNCYSDVAKFLGAPRSGNGYQNIKRLIKEFELSVSHFWDSKHAGFLKAGLNNNKKHWTEVLTDGQPRRIQSKRIRRFLIESGTLYVCEQCGLEPNWNGKSLTLQVDHIDGNWQNCKKENLRFLCPNCHSQTTNFCNNGKGNKCKNCNKKITSKATWCKRCVDLCYDKSKYRKVKDRPDLSALLSETKRNGYAKTGKKYGVSDNTIRKWIKSATKLTHQLDPLTNPATIHL